MRGGIGWRHPAAAVLGLVIAFAGAHVFRSAFTSVRWQRFEVPGTDLVVRMPHEPEQTLETRRNIIGPPRTIASIAPPGTVVAEGVRQIMKELSAKVEEADKVEWGGLVGRRFEFTAPSQEGRPAMWGSAMVLYDGDGRVFIVSAVLPFDADVGLVGDFFDSVYTTDAQAPPPRSAQPPEG